MNTILVSVENLVDRSRDARDAYLIAKQGGVPELVRIAWHKYLIADASERIVHAWREKSEVDGTFVAGPSPRISDAAQCDLVSRLFAAAESLPPEHRQMTSIGATFETTGETLQTVKHAIVIKREESDYWITPISTSGRTSEKTAQDTPQRTRARFVVDEPGVPSASITFHPGDALPVDGRVSLLVKAPFSVKVQDGKWAVEEWQLERCLEADNDLPWHIVHAILDLQCRAASAEGLPDEDMLLFARMCESLDWRKLSAQQAPPSYLEGRVKIGGNAPVLALNWEREWQPPAHLAPRFQHVAEGDDFWGWFCRDENGEITEVLAVRSLEPASDEQIARYLAQPGEPA